MTATSQCRKKGFGHHGDGLHRLALQGALCLGEQVDAMHEDQET
jgi:hypothetical protein